jgi:hypothetical protein
MQLTLFLKGATSLRDRVQRREASPAERFACHVRTAHGRPEARLRNGSYRADVDLVVSSSFPHAPVN